MSLRTLTRLTTPFIAFGIGFALYPKEWRKGKISGDRKVSDLNQSLLEQISQTEEFQRVNSNELITKHNSSSLFPVQHLKNHVGSGLLFGPDLFEIDPIIFLDKQEGQLTSFYHLGKKLISQDGKIHNGIVSTILDEGLCSCGFAKLPSKKGVTAKLSIDFKNQAPPNSTVILKGKVTESKGRKVVIDGYLETLPMKQGEVPLRIAESRCILVEPKWFKYLSWLHVF